MPFHLTSDQDLIRKTVRELVEDIKGKTAEEIDRERRWPRAELQKLAQLGLTAMLIPADKGGAGTDTVSFVLALEEVARASGTVAVALNNLNALGTYPVAARGDEALRNEVLPGAVSGEQAIAWALTEPNAGSDLGNVGTRAAKKDGAYRLTGLKSFVVGAPEAAWLVVFARVDKQEGLTALLVPADAPGVKVAPPEASMTLHGLQMAQVFLKDVEVPESRRLGAEGDGLALAGECHDLAALGAAAVSIGLMQAALEDACQYANTREQFRMPIKRFQAIQFLVAEMDVKLRAARALAYVAADRRDRGEEFATDAAAAKLHAAEAAKFVTQKSLRIHGGTGFMRDLPVERYNRDAASLSIYAGTSEAQRAALAAKALGL